MCGLVALISPGVPFSAELLSDMRDRLVHRGPDSAGLWMNADRRIGLAHRRLSIIDRSAQADQPMVSGDGRYQLVFNGEIYNYLELRSELARLGCAFKTQSDTEVLLAALSTWGEAALLRLNGMFAFALWDSETRLLTIARDRFGEKPLFIGRGRFGTVAMASEMKAILAHPHMSSAVDESSISDLGAGLWRESDERTFFANIKRIPPAHLMVFDSFGRERRRARFWTPDYTIINEKITPEEASEEFATHLRRSVRLRMRSDVAVGSSLSGGLDSSMIVAELAGQRATQPFEQNTFSACLLGDPTMSEEPDIDTVVGATGVRGFKTFPEPDGLMEDCRALHWHQEEPFLSASIYLQWRVARLAQQHDTIVLLDGQGADEVLGGYQSFFPLYQLDLLDRKRIGEVREITDLFNDRLKSVAEKYENVSRRFNPDVGYTQAQLSSLMENRPDVWHNNYGPGLPPAAPGWRLRRVLAETLLYNGLPALLRYSDRNAMAFGREPRTPYLDHDLVNFCMRLPDDILIHQGWQKWVLRKAVEKSLPASIAWRADKVGYAAPLDLWLRGKAKNWARERIFDSNVQGLPGYMASEVGRLWDEHQNGQANHSWALWRWISLAEWLDIHRCGYWRSGMSLSAA